MCGVKTLLRWIPKLSKKFGQLLSMEPHSMMVIKMNFSFHDEQTKGCATWKVILKRKQWEYAVDMKITNFVLS